MTSLLSRAVTLLGHIFMSLLSQSLYEILIASRVASINKEVADIQAMLDGNCGTNSGEAGFRQSKFSNEGWGVRLRNILAKTDTEPENNFPNKDEDWGQDGFWRSRIAESKYTNNDGGGEARAGDCLIVSRQAVPPWRKGSVNGTYYSPRNSHQIMSLPSTYQRPSLQEFIYYSPIVSTWSLRGHTFATVRTHAVSITDMTMSICCWCMYIDRELLARLDRPSIDPSDDLLTSLFMGTYFLTNWPTQCSDFALFLLSSLGFVVVYRSYIPSNYPFSRGTYHRWKKTYNGRGRGVFL